MFNLGFQSNNCLYAHMYAHTYSHTYIICFLGKPLYGDVFGTSDGYSQQATAVEEVDQTLWGEMESESEEEESSEEEEEEEEEAEVGIYLI